MQKRAFSDASAFGNTSVTSAYSVRFPFWLSIISDQDTGVDPFGNTPPYMLRVQAGRSITIPIKLQKDAIFKVLYAKFNALDNRDAINQFVSRTNGVGLQGSNKVKVNNLQGYAAAFQNMNYLRFTLVLDSIGGRTTEIAMPLSAVQGEQSGMCQLRHESLNPQSGVMTLKIENKAGWDIFVNGFFFGYKFRIGQV